MNPKNQPVIYHEQLYDSSGIKVVKHEAWLEGVQGDGSAIIRLEGTPFRVPARSLTRPDGSRLLAD